jgi:hypothetical protein
MRTIMIALLLGFCIAANSQITAPPEKKTEIGKLTQIVKSGEKSFRIITSHDSVAYWVRSKFEHTLITRITMDKKKDRSGDYWERSFYFKNESWDDVVNYIKPKLTKL